MNKQVGFEAKLRGLIEEEIPGRMIKKRLDSIFFFISRSHNVTQQQNVKVLWMTH